jgi:hypothetical protein
MTIINNGHNYKIIDQYIYVQIYDCVIMPIEAVVVNSSSITCV